MANSNDDIRSLGILSVVLAFLAAPGGLVVALIGKAKAKKHRQVTGMPAQGESLLKTGLICSIVMLVLIVISVGSLATWLAKHSSAGNLIGTWQCMSFENLSLSSFDDKMTFTDDNQYRFNIDGVARTGTYTIQPSTLNEPAWRSMKPTLQSYYNITDEDPETHILELDNGTAFTAIILNKTTGGRMMWVYAEVNNYICQNDPTEAPLGLLREQTLNQARQ
ncbi:MAG: hypothetical protein LBQ02_02285 [Candidatus Nomurabacteria bacterium]|jgi:hypothetical protein|nr:hypothetical protein [Candidatus Nomurabacteria bacterium]